MTNPSIRICTVEGTFKWMIAVADWPGYRNIILHTQRLAAEVNASSYTICHHIPRILIFYFIKTIGRVIKRHITPKDERNVIGRHRIIACYICCISGTGGCLLNVE